MLVEHGTPRSAVRYHARASATPMRLPPLSPELLSQAVFVMLAVIGDNGWSHDAEDRTLWRPTR